MTRPSKDRVAALMRATAEMTYEPRVTHDAEGNATGIVFDRFTLTDGWPEDYGWPMDEWNDPNITE